METGDKTAECLEMSTMNQGNRTIAVDDIDWCDSQIQCLCKWHVEKYYLVILNCRHRVVASQMDHQVELG